MSQAYVERVIGLLATDEALRRRFAEDPRATLQQLVEGGVQLNGCERHALASLDQDGEYGRLSFHRKHAGAGPRRHQAA